MNKKEYPIYVSDIKTADGKIEVNMPDEIYNNLVKFDRIFWQQINENTITIQLARNENESN